MENTWVKRNKWIFLVAPVAVAGFIWLFGELVMHLWNWLLPALFGWHPITFWQGLGLLILCRILFGGWGGGSNRSKPRRRMSEEWERLTPEEREKFQRTMRSRCGDWGPPAPGTGARA